MTKTEKKLKKIGILILWLVPPLIVWSSNTLFPTGFSEIIEINPGDYAVKPFTVTTTLPANSSNVSSSTLYQITSNQPLNNAIDNLGRFFPVVNIPPSLIRYNLFIKNDININISYSETSGGPLMQKSFQTTLSCVGKNLDYGKRDLITGGLYLGDKNDDDRNMIIQTVASCVDQEQLAVFNDTGKTLLVQNENLAPSSTLSFIVVPDQSSGYYMLIGWYLVWFGFLIIIREGILKSLKV